MNDSCFSGKFLVDVAESGSFKIESVNGWSLQWSLHHTLWQDMSRLAWLLALFILRLVEVNFVLSKLSKKYHEIS